MNWVCDSCGYENEYNDESQPTECLCCGEPASEHQLTQARNALEKYHKEQERQRRLEELRQKAIKRQEKIEHSLKAFVKCVKAVTTACMVVMMFSVALIGFNVYKDTISFKCIKDNIGNISVIENTKIPIGMISLRLSENTLGVKDTIIRNVNYATQNRNHLMTDNLKKMTAKNNEAITDTVMMIKKCGDNFKTGFENEKSNIVVPENNISNGFSNLTANWKLFWKQATQNIDQLVRFISTKIGRAK